jgi:kynurenine formamidase
LKLAALYAYTRGEIVFNHQYRSYKMCSPLVEKIVRERLQREGLPSVSRRSFLKMGGITAAVAAAASNVAFARSLRAQEMTGEIIDLSHILDENTPVYVGNKPARETITTIEDNGFYKQQWTFDEHSGTHLDAPGHFAIEGTKVHDMAVGQFFAPLVVLDISARAAEDPDTIVTVEDIEAWEEANGELPAGAFVAMYSGWDSKWEDEAAFKGTDADGVYHFPGFGIDAINHLLEDHDAVGIGVDTMSLDPGNSTTFDVHTTWLPAGRYGVENLANLGAVLGRPANIWIGIPRYREGSGGPLRAVAMV